MRAEEAVERHHEILWDAVRETEFPSPPMLDRLERALRTREDGEAYLDLLFEKVRGEYPSVQILARIKRVTDALAALEQLAASDP